MKGNPMKLKTLCLAAMLPLAACQQESATEGTVDGGKPAPGAIKEYRRVDPASLHSHLADSALPAMDSVRLLREEAAATLSPETRKALTKSAAGGTITLCTAINLAGTCATVPAGLDYNDLRFVNPWGNDAISSMDVSGGASVYLCDANNWGGPCYFIDRRVNDFRLFPNNGTYFNFNDKVTSFKFQIYADQNNFFTMYDSPYKGGESCNMYFPMDYNYPPCAFNDRTSSYWNYSDVQASVFNGATWTLEGFTVPAQTSQNVMPVGWDNVISSMKWVQ
jgi:hypothetical protein